VELKAYSLESPASTNEWVKSHLKELSKKALTVVSATEQTAGKGQRGKSWHSPPHVNLYLSFCFYVSKTEIEPLMVTHLLALVVASLLKEKGLAVRFKWPNDLLIDHKKVSGILCETVSDEMGSYYIVGLGLNVNMPQEECLKITQPATSILLETGKAQFIWEWKEKVVNMFKERVEAFLKTRSLPERELRELMSPHEEFD
jgi:BirA family transcriptional regulator, biotin operon repressor / biotin---[acetyl-CoA-carboxylase] ligase